jgi:hypothetical protein
MKFSYLYFYFFYKEFFILNMLNIGATCTYFVFCMPIYTFYYKASTDLKLFNLSQFIGELCCGSGSGIQCFFDPWTRIRDPE